MIQSAIKLTRTVRKHRKLTLGVAASLVAAMTLMGCMVGGTTGNTNTNNNGSNASGTFISLQSNATVSTLDQPITVFYSITGSATSASAFYRPIAESSSTSAPIGDDVTLSSNLTVGSNVAFNVDPAQLGVGFYLLGLSINTGTGTPDVVLSPGVLVVEGVPAPFFTQPADALTEVVQGDDIVLRWDNGDPEGAVQYRLFLTTDDPSCSGSPDQIGQELAVGSGNVGNYTLVTDNLDPGDYTVGVAATDFGLSVSSTISSGNAFRVVTVCERTIRVQDAAEVRQPPSFAFVNPGSADVVLFRDEPFTAEFLAAINEPDATGTVELFYDTDRDFNNGFQPLTEAGQELAPSETEFPLPVGDLPEGDFFIGGIVSDGINDDVVKYATGMITLIRTPTLQVLTPNTDATIAPGSEVNVTWTTNVPADRGNVTVFARRVGEAGDIAILPPDGATDAEPASTTSAIFTPAEAGLYEIFVRIDYVDGGLIEDQSPQDIRVSSAPTILWVGSIATAAPRFDGAIFQGVNFEDNAGSAFASPGDLSGDGRAEFVIAARYGKPFFNNPSGIGPGEAYLVYGGSGNAKVIGEFSLNSVGGDSLAGLVFAGVRTALDGNNNPTDDTDGMSDITAIPDADGDDIPELVFGFPRTNSQGNSITATGAQTRPFDLPGQFLRGGVVVVSSQNQSLQNPESAIQTINCDEVGQFFASPNIPQLNVESIYPTTVPGNLVADECRAVQGEETPSADCGGNCIGGQNDGFETITGGPGIGFNQAMSPRLVDILGLIDDGACLERNVWDPVDGCGSIFDGAATGSGFFPGPAGLDDDPDTADDNVSPSEPLGARIIGELPGDGFGTFIAFSQVDELGVGDLIISSPSRDGRASEIDGLESDATESGVAYLTNNRNNWGINAPRPHQYQIDTFSYCGDARLEFPPALRVAGDQSDNIRKIVGIDDFNEDGRNDFAVGSPTAGGGLGRVYVAFRRSQDLEGDFVLSKLENDINDPERLTGALFISNVPAQLGASLATGVDFNHDGVSDLVVGAPNTNGGIGEVIIIFGDGTLSTPINGLSINSLLQSRAGDGQPRAVRISGNVLDPTGNFGFNVANAGDVDGDGLNDLLVAAPNATPRFDPSPTDDDDSLTDKGVDQDLDGIRDDVSGPNGVADGCPGIPGCDDTFDQLDNAGLVYLISSRNQLNNLDQNEAGIIEVNINQLGTLNLRGLIIAGRRAGDRMGGGDAGDTALGGVGTKLNRGRSEGLAAAGDVDGDGRDDILIGSVLADPGVDPGSGEGRTNAGEAYLIYGEVAP